MNLFRLLCSGAAVAAVLSLAACGTSSGGGAEPAPIPEAPGVLRVVAIQGMGAIGTAGFYNAIPAQPYMDAHASGWVAFVAPTTDPMKTSVVHAMAPDGTVMHVFGVGEPAPGLVDGEISGFRGVWVGNDFLYAFVDVINNTAGHTFGIVSASLSNAAGAFNRVGVIYHLEALPVGGTVAAIDEQAPDLESDGTFWFLATGTGDGEEHLFSIERDGNGLVVRAQVTAALPGGATIDTVDAFDVEPGGTWFAIAVDALVPGGARRGVYVRNTGLAAFEEVLVEDAGVPGTGDTIDDIHVSGTLSVYNDSRVAWMGSVVGATPNQVFLTGTATGPASVIALARSGDVAPLSSMGMFTGLGGLNARSSVTLPQFSAGVAGSGNGVTFGTYGMVGSNPPVAVLATDNQSLTTAGVMGPTYPGLATTTRPYREVSQNSSFLFANVLQNGRSAVLWLIPGERIYALAVEGEAAPLGDTFGSFAATSAQTVANGTALFRAPLSSSGSGLFRRGP